jgi:cytochrome oxidase assembly protein ShyY1
MTHLPYIVGSYGLAFGITGWLIVGAWRRMGAARRKLAAIDPRAGRE